eukprot:7137334-Alexandrium_andersonii.AAC.1
MLQMSTLCLSEHVYSRRSMSLSRWTETSWGKRPEVSAWASDPWQRMPGAGSGGGHNGEPAPWHGLA